MSTLVGILGTVFGSFLFLPAIASALDPNDYAKSAIIPVCSVCAVLTIWASVQTMRKRRAGRIVLRIMFSCAVIFLTAIGVFLEYTFLRQNLTSVAIGLLGVVGCLIVPFLIVIGVLGHNQDFDQPLRQTEDRNSKAMNEMEPNQPLQTTPIPPHEFEKSFRNRSSPAG